MQRIVIMPDVQAPLHDKPLVKRFVNFLKDYQPDGLVQVGDLTDSTEVGRWVRGYAKEHDNLRAGLDEAEKVVRDIRAVYSGPFDIERSNHDDRTEKYIAQYAPALASLGDFSIRGLLHLDDYGVNFHRKPFPVAPGWLVMHGDEGGLSRIPGQTAMKLAEGAGMSVACGHGHRAGLMHKTFAHSGKVVQTLYGMEVGNFMDLRRASYLGSGGANWAQAFGLLYVEGSQVTPSLVMVAKDGSFTVEGERYK